MARNHYEAAFGVVPIRWRKGEPPTSGRLVLVEVWRSSLANVDPNWANPNLPRVSVEARIEVRFHDGSSWKVLGYHGAPLAPIDGEVRRWAILSSRSWLKSITLDGWDAVPSGSETP